jgi:adenine deaminase
MKPINDLVSVARGRVPADLVLKNAKVFNVFTGQFICQDVAIVKGWIAGVGNYTGMEELDLAGKYVTPGFVDGHVHIESSLVNPAEFARALVSCGTTTVMADPHEIANVAGADGIRYMLAASKHLPLNVYILLPSCVPTSFLETTGANLAAAHLTEFIHHSRVLGLGEMMDYSAVLAQASTVLEKIYLADGKIIDGHSPGLTGKDLTAYIAAGIRSDHECMKPAEALEKLAQGMFIMLREGSAAKNLLNLLPILNQYTARRCFFVTDDRHPEDLITVGHINYMVKLASEAGTDLATVLQLATMNAARYFHLDDVGAIAPGYKADILVFPDLRTWQPELVLKDGRIVAREGRITVNIPTVDDTVVRNTVHLGRVEQAQLRIRAGSSLARVIGLVPHELITEVLEMEVPVADGEFRPDATNDLLKIAVFERHNRTGNVGVGIVKGFGLRSGAIATTIAHDSHNLVVVGASDEDMIAAVREIDRVNGGITIVREGCVLGTLPLPLAGLMSDRNIYTVRDELVTLQHLARSLGVKECYDPFMTLSFLSLPVIPSLKLTDKGLVDVNQHQIVSVSK